MSPQPTAPAAESAGTLDVGQAFLDKAWEIREEYTKVVAARKSNRDTLRGMVTQGMLSAEQIAEVDELYPEREQVKLSAEERAAKLEAEAKAVREKAKAAAKANGAS